MSKNERKTEKKGLRWWIEKVKYYNQQDKEMLEKCKDYVYYDPSRKIFLEIIHDFFKVMFYDIWIGWWVSLIVYYFTDGDMYDDNDVFSHRVLDKMIERKKKRRNNKCL